MRKSLLLLTTSLMIIACGGDSSSNLCAIDEDQDGYVTGSDCSAVNSEMIDCDDNNKLLWSMNSDNRCKKSCLDTDQDGYFSQCDRYPVVDGIEKIDCDDNNSLAWTTKDGTCLHPCSDIDQDGYYFDCETKYPDDKIDCYDKNSTIWRINPDTGGCLYSCVDRDKDGYFFGCDNYPVDENNLPKIDCNDDDQLVHTPVSETDLTCKSSCIDQDGDGYYINCERFDATHPEDDCDGDKANWKADQCRYLGHDTTVLNPNSTCVDNDGDGYYQSCNSYIDGLKGPDCNDTPDSLLGSNNYKSCNNCVDDDGDGDYVGCDSYQDGLTHDEDDHVNTFDTDYDLLVLANLDLIKELTPKLLTYRHNYPNHKIAIHYIAPTTVQALKAYIKHEYQQHHIKGAFLIGELPAAWYQKEIPGEDGYEYTEWPIDSYLGNFSVTWYDDNNDGLYDRHTSSRVKLDIYTARLQGDIDQITAYFDRVDRYINEGPLVANKAFIFVDDVEPSAYVYNVFFTILKQIYPSSTLYTSKADTTKENYINYLTQNGAEFVYQAIHAYPSALAISRNSESDYQELSIHELDRLELKGSFYTMLNCTASRFTEPNLATTYTHQPNGLATFGCTQSLPAYDPRHFHARLKAGDSWGEGYKYWYNYFDQYDGDFFENNFSGMMIMGDPLLILKESSKINIPNTTNMIPPLTKALKRALTNDAVRQHRRIKDKLGTFEQYKSNHPQFFKD